MTLITKQSVPFSLLGSQFCRLSSIFYTTTGGGDVLLHQGANPVLSHSTEGYATPTTRVKAIQLYSVTRQYVSNFSYKISTVIVSMLPETMN